MIVFAFSDNLSAEHSKLSAESGLQGLQLLECMIVSDDYDYDYDYDYDCDFDHDCDFDDDETRPPSVFQPRQHCCPALPCEPSNVLK